MNKEKEWMSSEKIILDTLSLQNIQEFRQQIGIFFKTWMIEWIKLNQNKNYNILQYIEYNKQLKLEMDREFNQYINKQVLKEINNQILKDKVKVNTIKLIKTKNEEKE